MTIEPLKFSLAQIVEMTGESLPTIHDAIKAGHLKTFLCGRRRYARRGAVEAWVRMFEKASDAGKPLCYRARPQERRTRA